MKRHLGIANIIFIAAIAWFSADVHAIDSVKVKYIGGMPLPNMSSEGASLEVTRVDTRLRQGDADIDTFFSAVRNTLLKYRIAKDWRRVSPDAPSVQVDIELDGRRITIAVNADERQRSRIPSSVGEMDDDVRHIAAMDDIIRLVRDRTNARLVR